MSITEQIAVLLHMNTVAVTSCKLHPYENRLEVDFYRLNRFLYKSNFAVWAASTEHKNILIRSLIKKLYEKWKYADPGAFIRQVSYFSEFSHENNSSAKIFCLQYLYLPSKFLFVFK